MIAYDFSDIKPYPYLNVHQTIRQSFLNCELFEDTYLSSIA